MLSQPPHGEKQIFGANIAVSHIAIVNYATTKTPLIFLSYGVFSVYNIR